MKKALYNLIVHALYTFIGGALLFLGVLAIGLLWFGLNLIWWSLTHHGVGVLALGGFVLVCWTVGRVALGKGEA